MDQMLKTSRYRVEGMDCAACARKIETAARRVPGVADVAVSATAGTMTVHHDTAADLEELGRRIGRLGYRIAMSSGSQALPAAQGDGSCDGHDHADHDHADHSHAGHDHGGRRAEAAGHAGPSLHGQDRGQGHGQDHGHARDDRPWWRSGKGLLTIASGVALVLAYGAGKFVPALGASAFIAAMLVGLVPIARRAAAATLQGSPFTIELLMTVAAVGAVVIGAAEEAAAVVFLFLVGELLEGVAASRARSGIRALTALVPKTALVEEEGRIREVAADRLEPGMAVLVRPGDRLPADGIVTAGESLVDEAPVTGESVPVAKAVEALVFAGTVNGEGTLHIRVTAAAADNTIARIVKLVEEAQEARAPTERLIDRFSRWYTPGVMAVAALVAVVPPLAFGGTWEEWIYKGLAVLLIGCPCALVISVPAAIAASLAAGARRGLLMKGGAVLEALGGVTMACFDKTGTLTEGRPKVTDIVSFGPPVAEALRLAAAVEQGSNHPLAVAVLARAAEEAVAPPAAEEARAIGGKGVVARVEGRDVFLGSPRAAAERASLDEGRQAAIDALRDAGKSVAVLLVDGAPWAAIAMRDEPRADAAAGIAALTRLGVGTLMLTGDNAATARAIGSRLGIEVRAELLPEDKQRIVAELKGEGFRVAKIGDGINDAPALAAADVGIAMGGGTDVALETADAAVLHGRVGDVAAMIWLSRRTAANIRQNIAIALGLKAVFLVTTVLGVTGLWPAILADTGATVLVTANAVRLLGTRFGPVAQ